MKHKYIIFPVEGNTIYGEEGTDVLILPWSEHLANLFAALEYRANSEASLAIHGIVTWQVDYAEENPPIWDVASEPQHLRIVEATMPEDLALHIAMKKIRDVTTFALMHQEGTGKYWFVGQQDVPGGTGEYWTAVFSLEDIVRLVET